MKSWSRVHSMLLLPLQNLTPLHSTTPLQNSPPRLHSIEYTVPAFCLPTPPTRLSACLSVYLHVNMCVGAWLAASPPTHPPTHPPTSLSVFQPCPDLAWPATNLLSSLVKCDLFRLTILYMLSVDQAFCESLYLFSE